MENLNEPRNIMGMADILADEDEDLNIEELERSIINGVPLSKQDDKSFDMAKEYDRELDQLSKQFGIKSSYDNDDDMPRNSKPMDFDFNADDSREERPKSKLDDMFDTLPSFNDSKTDEDGAEIILNDDDSNEKVNSSWNTGKPIDSQLSQMTTEERKQRHINRVLGTIDKSNDDNTFIQEEEEEDEMAKVIEQIDQLKQHLESEGIDLTRIPEVNTSTSRKEARAVLRILQIKNDRIRYCDMFEEGILAMAYGLESMFDGKKVWFGSQIDLTGWPDSCKVKLRRMRYDTSAFVGEIIKGYSIGSGWRILLELLPSLFLYSRDRRIKSNDNLISDDKYRTAIRNLQ